MTTPDATPTTTHGHKPLDNEFDVYGLTHTGKVRETNQDNFLLASLHKRMQVHFTSLQNLTELPRLRFIHLRDTNVTDAGVAALQKALPHCKILLRQ